MVDRNTYTARGFTDHEHRFWTGFVHMNGRVYDPRLGRFVSPDPIAQAPHFSQSYNRYAYVWNRPLSIVDPTGFQGRVVDEIVVTGVRPEPTVALTPVSFMSELRTRTTPLPHRRAYDTHVFYSGERNLDIGEVEDDGVPTNFVDQFIDKDGTANIVFAASVAEGAKYLFASGGRCEPCHNFHDRNVRDLPPPGQVLSRGANVTLGAVQLGGGALACKTVIGCILGAPLIASGLGDVSQGFTNQGLAEQLLGPGPQAQGLDLTLSLVGAQALPKASVKLAFDPRFAPDVLIGANDLRNSIILMRLMRNERNESDGRQ